MRNVTTVGIDLAKNVFSLHASDAAGNGVLSRKLLRSQLTGFIAQLPPCLIGMEACSGAHEWARQFNRARPQRAAHGGEVCRTLAQEREERSQ